MGVRCVYVQAGFIVLVCAVGVYEGRVYSGYRCQGVKEV